MRHRLFTLPAAAATGCALALAAIAPAAAHDVHTFGKVTVALGWLHEPAYTGFDNAVQVLVKDDKGNPITSITDKDLTVEVSLDSQKMSAQPLLPTADPDTGLGIPGEYELHFIPTIAGKYAFHIKGTVAGQAIDETVTASDKTFNEVRSDSDVEFPAKVPAVGDVATKVDKVSSRVDALQASTTAQDAKDSANRALVIGIVALALAVVLSAGNLVIATRRSKSQS